MQWVALALRVLDNTKQNSDVPCNWDELLSNFAIGRFPSPSNHHDDIDASMELSQRR